MNALSRRNFLSAALAAAGAAAASAAGSAPVPEKWDVECDILVVGGGGSGLAAAASAKEAGAGRVLLIEKNATLFQNSTSLSNGDFTAACTRVMKEQGVADPGPQVFAREMVKGGNGKNDLNLVKVYTENSGETIDWLLDQGITFELKKNAAFSDMRYHHITADTGSKYVEVISERARKLGVEFRFRTRAMELVTDPSGSEVLGVNAESGGARVSIRALKAVVLCTGGFMASPRLIDRHLIDFQGAISCAAPASTGDGILMGQKAGAGTYLLSAGAVYCYGVPVDVEKRRGLIFRGHFMGLYGSIAVGEDGRRFVADEASATTAGRALSHRGLSWSAVIATEWMVEDFMANDRCQVVGWTQDRFRQELAADGVFCHKAGTIRELAEKLGIDPGRLEKTVSDYNGYVRAGRDLEFDRQFMKGTFEKGPFYGFKCRPVCMANLGGLKAGPTMEILDVYDSPIKRLYAAGETLGGVHGNSYLGGDSIGATLTIGRYVGKLVAGL